MSNLFFLFIYFFNELSFVYQWHSSALDPAAEATNIVLKPMNHSGFSNNLKPLFFVVTESMWTCKSMEQKFHYWVNIAI